MRLLIALFAGAVLLSCSSLSVFAQASRTVFMGGNELFRLCDGPPRSAEWGVCNGYIEGVADAYSATQYYCPADKVSLQQVVDIVLKYLRSHPEKRHYSAVTTIAVALREVFFCQQ
jgi:hypothetical protein